MFEVIIWFFPSLVGLILVLLYILALLRLARRSRSVATHFVFAIWFSFLSVVLSWFVVLAIAIEQVAKGVPVISWQVVLLPAGWALVAWLINYLVRR